MGSSQLEHSFEIVVIGLVAEQCNGVAVELAPIQHRPDDTGFPISRRTIEQVPAAKRQPLGSKPRLACEKGLEVFANKVRYGVTQYQVVPSKPTNLAMTTAEYVEIRRIASRGDSLDNLQ